MTRAAVVAAVVAIAACHPAPKPTAAQLPTDAQLHDGSAAFAPAERYRGHPVVLDFWAGWCEECRTMVPQLARLTEAFAADGLVVIGIDAGEAPDEAARYAKALGITYPIAYDPDLVYSDRVGAGELPALLVIDRTGTIVHRSRRLDEDTLGAIRRVLH